MAHNDDLDPRQIDKLVKQLDALTRGLGTDITGRKSFSSKSSPSEVKVNKGLKDVGHSLKDAADALSEVAVASKNKAKYLNDQKALEKYTRSLSKLNASLDNAVDINDSVNKTLDSISRKSLNKQIIAIDKLARSTDGLSSQFSKGKRQVALLSSSLMSTHENFEIGSASYEKYINDLGDSAKLLNRGILKTAGVFDESSNTIKEGLDATDFSKLRVRIGEVGVALQEGISKLGFGNIDDMISMSEKELKKNFAAQKAKHADAPEKVALAIAQMQKMGVDAGPKVLDKHGDIDDTAIKKLMADSNALDEAFISMIKVARENAQATKQMDANVRYASGATGLFAKKIDQMSEKAANFLTGAGAAAASAKGFDMMKEGLTGFVKEIFSFNTAQLPIAYKETWMQARQMGMTFDETVQFLKDGNNKRLLALQGPGGFSQTTKKLSSTLLQFGYTAKQSAEIIGPGIEAAIASGVNVQDGNKLNGFIEDSMNSFRKISGIVDISAKDYFKLNAALANSAGISETLLGLDKKQSLAYRQNLQMQRDKYVADGLSLDQAQALVKANEDAKRDKVNTRVRNAAMKGLRAQMAGMDPAETAEMQRIERSGKAATAEESARLADWNKRYQKATNEWSQRYTGTGFGAGQMTVDVIDENTGLEGSQAAVAQGNIEAIKADRAGLKATEAQKVSAEEKSKADVDIAALGDSYNKVTSLLNDNLGKALTGAVIGLGGLLASSLLLSAQFARMSLGGGLPGLGGAASAVKKPGVFARAASSVKNFFGGGAKAAGSAEQAAASAANVGSKAAGAVEGAASGAANATSAAAKVSNVGKVAALAGKAAPALKVLGAVGAVADVGFGLNDLAHGKEKKELKGLDYISPMALGMRAGYAINKGVENTTGGSIGSHVYDGVDKVQSWFGYGDAVEQKKQDEALAAAIAAYKAKRAAKAQADAQAAKQKAMVVATPALTTPKTVTLPGAQPTTTTVNNNTTAAGSNSSKQEKDKTISVHDAETQQALLSLAESMDKAVKFLQQMTEMGLTSVAGGHAATKKIDVSKQVPTAHSYVTGRTSI